MKKLFFGMIAFLAIACSQNVSAQQYFTYDGSEFSILITTDNANKKVTNVEFSYGGEWMPFAIDGSANLDGTKDGGFIFFCRDGQNQYFAVDYYRSGDYVLVHPSDADHNYDNTSWKCTRRAE